jgi:hypothetical protein
MQNLNQSEFYSQLCGQIIKFSLKNKKLKDGCWPVCIAPEFVDSRPMSEIKNCISEKILSNLQKQANFEIFDMFYDLAIGPQKISMLTILK